MGRVSGKGERAGGWGPGVRVILEECSLRVEGQGVGRVLCSKGVRDRLG